MVGVENIPRRISYKLGHSRVSLDLPFNLEIHNLKIRNSRFLIFSHFDYSFANISRFMGPRLKIVGVKNVRREISYKVGHSGVSLDLPFNLEIH